MTKQQATLFLKDLMSKIQVSDDREKFDSKPMLFFIEETTKINADSGFSDGSWFVADYDPEVHFDSEDELNEYLESDESEDRTAKDFSEISFQKIKQTKDLAFLTRESCQDHIDRNSHHYTNARTYPRGVWRDPLMEGLFKALNALYRRVEK